MRRRSYPRGRTLLKAKPWYERDGGERLARDRQVIAEPYPDLSYRIDREAERAYLGGSITLRSDCGIRTKIDLKVVFPYSYPKLEPRAYDVAGKFRHVPDRHFYPDGCCCLWLPPESLWDADDPNGLRVFLNHVSIFFDKQLICDALGGNAWPGEARSHGYLGYVEFVQEMLKGNKELMTTLAPIFAKERSISRNDLCPCGRGFKFKRCHLDAVEEVSRRVGISTLRDTFRAWDRHASASDKLQAGII